MHTVRKNNQFTWEANILVYAEDQERLWEYRNILNEIEPKSPCKFEITLTSRLETAYSVSEFLPGGVDLYLSDGNQKNHEEMLIGKRIQKRHPECRCLYRKPFGYDYTYVTEDEPRKIRHIRVLKKELEIVIFGILSDLLKSADKGQEESGQ